MSASQWSILASLASLFLVRISLGMFIAVIIITFFWNIYCEAFRKS